MSSLQMPNETDESSFPVISSVGEVPRTMGKSNRLGMTVDESREKVYIISSEGNTCHVVTYSFALSSSLLQKTCFLFEQSVDAAELYRRDDKVSAVVITSDGRLWHGAMDSVERGTFPYSDAFTEVSLKQRLMGIEFISVCKDCLDGLVVAAVATSPPSPPQVLWLGHNGTDTNIISNHVPGLEHIHTSITSALFLSRDNTSPAFWSLLTTEQSSDDSSIESILLLGFADGAIRLCLLTDSKMIRPVRLLIRIDSTKQQVVSILAMRCGSQSLVDAICAVGRNGAVSTLNESGNFQHIFGGLRLKGPWKSAVMIECTDKNSILAIRQDGSSHLLVIADKDSTGKDCLCMPLPVRSSMSTANACMISGGAWVVFGSIDGSVILMHVDSNIYQKLLAWEGSNDKTSGILDVVGEAPGVVSSANSTHGLLLQRLRRYDQVDMDASANAKELSPVLDADLQHAMDTTEFVMKVAPSASNQKHGRTKSVTVFEEDDTITVKTKPPRGMVSSLAERTWTSSLHSCFETQGDDDESENVVQRLFGTETNRIPVHYGSVAVTDCRAMEDSVDVIQRIERKSGAKTVDAFLSVTDTREPSIKQKDTLLVESKRRKTEPTDASISALPVVP